ncbi:MAG TPA: hypothetical protein VFO30_00390, partial [Chthoniobacterales bacterium]|nr:hypothetical protein [Chthoniobacterales bacterium]
RIRYGSKLDALDAFKARHGLLQDVWVVIHPVLVTLCQSTGDGGRLLRTQPSFTKTRSPARTVAVAKRRTDHQ